MKSILICLTLLSNNFLVAADKETHDKITINLFDLWVEVDPNSIEQICFERLLREISENYLTCEGLYPREALCIGSAEGYDLLAVHEAFGDSCEIYGIDTSLTDIEISKIFCSRMKNIRSLCGDATERLPNRNFDLILIRHPDIFVYKTENKWESLFQNLLQRITIGGLLIVTTYSMDEFKSLREFLNPFQALALQFPLEVLLQGINPFSSGHTVLSPMGPIGRDQYIKVFRRIQNGITMPKEICEMCNEQQISDLIKLIQEGSLENLDARDERGSTLLHLAAGMGHIELLEALLHGGANPNTYSFAGLTPLHSAVIQSQLQCVRILCNAGTNIEAMSNLGCTSQKMTRNENIKEELDERKTKKDS